MLLALISFSYDKNQEAINDRSYFKEGNIDYQKEVWKLLEKQIRISFSIFTPIKSYLKGTVFEGLDYKKLEESYNKKEETG